LAAAQGALNAARYGAGLVVLGIQNLLKVYPLPFERLQRFVFNRTTTAVYTSVQAAEILKRRGFDGRLIPMPFSTDLTVPSHERKAAIRAAWDLRGPLAGFSGRLVPEKGIDVFLKALAQLPAVNGAIIGTGPEQDALQGLARDLGIHERVRFLQPEGPARAMELLSALDVLALPSRTMPNWAEQFGRVLIEAMATGVAVVASDSGAIGEVVGDAGLLVPENDSDALAAGLQRALKDPARLIERGLERVRARYTSAVEADALQTALEAAALSVKLAGVSSKDEVA
jgi:glycosyltransferase involved in cell wall biosynthesis